MSGDYFDVFGYLHCINPETRQNLFKNVEGKTTFEKLVDKSNGLAKERIQHVKNDEFLSTASQLDRADDFAKALHKIRWGTIT